MRTGLTFKQWLRAAWLPLLLAAILHFYGAEIVHGVFNAF